MTKILNKTLGRRLTDQRGNLIIFAVLFLTTIMVIALTVVAIFLPKIRLVSDVTRSTNAVFAADSAMEWCLYGQRGNLPLALSLVMTNGATYQIFFANVAVVACNPTQNPINHRTIGTYAGVSRAYELSQ